MKRLLIFSLICFLSGLLTVACERNQGVQAGREGGSETYQPRPAPKGEIMPQRNEVKGELTRVDMDKKTFTIRAENGMEQTFKFTDDTSVMGVESMQLAEKQAQRDKNAAVNRNLNQIRNLVGKEGSEVTVRWKDEGGAKTAISVNVTQVTVQKGKAKAKAGKY